MFRHALLGLVFVGLSASASPALASAKGAPQTHVVQKGQRLGSIAKRYNVTIEAIAYANGIREHAPIKPGQRLVIPDRSDKDGSEARAANPNLGDAPDPATRRASLERPSNGRRRSGPAWQDYAHTPKRKNWVEISNYNSKWRGLVIDAKGKLRPAARQAIAELLSATGDHPGPPDRLLRLIVDVSNTFGGRPIHIVSGYRTTSFFRDSRHKTSQAMDFMIVGVPNAVARDYLLTLDNVGVGFYPNSTFLHLDVRPHSTRWIDYAGPGEAPRKSPHGAPAQTPVDFDELAEQAAEGTSHEPSSPARDATAESASAPSSGGETTGSVSGSTAKPSGGAAPAAQP
ncbi:MAG TPA: LysM peptidoglycan-binding domain-containing protein [Polyangiaceae bacterium]|nr:LysM peptidoglycan-binding domain-containing protein [Polyangiaceae bacterium]